MIKPGLHRCLLALCFTCLLPLHAFAEAPVVDDSENYAMLDEQAMADRPDTRTQPDEKYNYKEDEEVPLVRENELVDNSNDANPLLKIQSMQQEIRELRGQLEVQAHELKLLKQQQLAFYKDLDARLSSSGPKAAPVQANAEVPVNIKEAKTQEPIPQKSGSDTMASMEISPSRANPADEQISYLAAYDLVKNKRYEEARTAMQAFVQKYPRGGYTANAQYWLGELYMVEKNYSQAISHFEIVLKEFPNSSKAAACTLKIGYALASSGKRTEARARLHQVLKNYPDTTTAQLAATRLQSLNAS